MDIELKEQQRKEKRREYDRNWRARHPEKKKEKDNAYQKTHPGKHNEITRRWAQANPEKVRVMGRRWKAANREKVNEQQRLRRKANQERERERGREYREKNKDKRNEMTRRWRKENRDKVQLAKKCIVCKVFYGVRRFIKAENKYKYCCAGCFYHLHPNEKIPSRYKKKQNYIHDEIKGTFGDDYFKYDAKIEGGCSKRLPDWFRDCLTHSVIIECDEDQHKKEDAICEHKRMMMLFVDLANRPIVFIRFNPDKYRNREGRIVRGCFKFDSTNNIDTFREEFISRFEALKHTVQEAIETVPQKEVSIIHLFYDWNSGTCSNSIPVPLSISCQNI